TSAVNDFPTFNTESHFLTFSLWHDFDHIWFLGPLCRRKRNQYVLRGKAQPVPPSAASCGSFDLYRPTPILEVFAERNAICLNVRQQLFESWPLLLLPGVNKSLARSGLNIPHFSAWICYTVEVPFPQGKQCIFESIHDGIIASATVRSNLRMDGTSMSLGRKHRRNGPTIAVAVG